MNEEYKKYLQNARKNKISEHFTIFDVCNSVTAIKLNIDNRPTAQVITNATALAKNVLEKLFIKFGITSDCINSWFRNLLLNKKVGSSDSSQHPKGMAVDFTPKKQTIEEVFQWIKKNLIFDQLIQEGTWIHVSFNLVHNRGQALRLVNGKYIAG